MVGLSDQFERVKQSLKKTHISLNGMAGIDKQVFEDPLILNHFECRSKFKFNGISVAQAILAELDPTNYYKLLHTNIGLLDKFFTIKDS